MKCPVCKSKSFIKKGKRKTKYTMKQVYYCKKCGKRFVNKKLVNKTYPSSVVINAINYYNLGYTLEESSRLVNRRFKVKISKSSLQRWLAEFSDVCSFGKIRNGVYSDFKKGEVVFTNIFRHQGLEYVFRYHRAKLERYALGYPSLVEYIKRFEQGCPEKMFEDGERCSKIKLDVDIRKSRKKTQACSLAELALKAVENNRKRHDNVEEFMLINDTATVACETPVWYWDKNLDINISGHIDLLQIRGGWIYVLDFKPDAAEENGQKVASQLFLYARGLSYRTGIPLNRFRCAWFDERDYYEFYLSMVEMKKM
jgi:transposase-like protein